MTTQLALRIPNDPTDPHAEARTHVVSAIATAAEMHGGTVDPNEVRTILAAVPEWDVPPAIVGRTYQDLKQRGRLVEVGTTRSDDTRSGNRGRLVPVYRLVDGGAA